MFIIENGTPIEIYADGSARRAAPVPAGYVYVDGLSVGDVGDIVLRDRRALANDGMFMVVVTVDKQTGSVVGQPEIITRGFVHLNEQDPIMKEAVDRVVEAIEKPGDHISEIALLKTPDQGWRLALPVRADEAPADGLPGRRRGLRWPPAAARRPQDTRATLAGAACRARWGSRSRPTSSARSSG